MGKRVLSGILLLLSAVFVGQISVKVNLPEKIKPGTDVPFEARIWKGPLKNFSKYQIELPQGITISEVDCRTGSFSQEGNLVKIIWAITPPENEFIIALKLSSSIGIKGKQSIVHKYFYLEKGEKREIEMPLINIDFSDSTTSALAVEKKTELTEPAVVNDLPGQEELKQQVVQLKKDAKDAREVGEAEKLAAQKKLTEANAAVEKAKSITGEKERSIALQKAMTAKDKAETDLAMANRILTLSASLEENALEIEKLNQSLDVVQSTEQKTNTNNVGKESTVATGTTPSPKINTSDIEKARQEAIKKGTKDAKGLYKPVAIGQQNTKELIQQVNQIKKDAKDAREVGTREKKKAEQKLNESYQALKGAEYINDAEEKRMAIEKANQDKAKAEKDLEIAAKILTLAKSLEDNAKQIENANSVVKVSVEEGNQPVETTLPAASVTPVKEKAPVVDKPKAEEKTPDKPAPIASAEKIDKPAKKENVVESTTTSTGLVFRIQVGAFSKTPDKTQFTKLGKVDVIKEGAMFKALFGNFKTREEAVAQREQVRAKGFDPFIVTFQDGVKIK